jgi:hypothetical protein
MARPRKVVASVAPAPAAAVSTTADGADSNAIFFDDGDSGSPVPDVVPESEDSSGGEGEPPAATTPALVVAAPAPQAQLDLSLFLTEMQLLRETMQSQRTQLDSLHHQRVREQQESDLRVRSLQQQIMQMQHQLQQPPSPEEPPPPPTPITTFSAFRNTAPTLPRQHAHATTPSPPTARTHARLGLTGDLPNTSKQHQNHMTELKLGSRYIVKGSNGLS